MIDASQHYIRIEPSILARQWKRYGDAYQNIENCLPRYGSVPAAFVFKTHPLGGFLLRREPQSPFQEFFHLPSSKFVLTHAAHGYSRGLDYYPGLRKDLPDLHKIRFMLKVIRDITDLFGTADEKAKIGSVYAAAAQDYVRNYLLILYHAFTMIAYRQNVILAHQETLNQMNNQLKSVILNTEISLFKYCSAEGEVASLPIGELKAAATHLGQFFDANEAYIDEMRNGKLIREVREMDSLTHIFHFAKKIADMRTQPTTLLIGLQYGGIELPFAVNAMRILAGKHVLPAMTLKISHYSNKAFTPKQITDIAIFSSERQFIRDASAAWILDDSISTARSIECVVRLLGPQIAAHIGVVAFKVSNRYHHLTMEGHGGFSPTVALGSIILCQANYSSTYKRNSYLNRSGVFDVNKYNLYKMLGKELL